MSSKKRKTPSITGGEPHAPPTVPAPAAATSTASVPQKWRCDICLTAVFDTYDEAVVHERGCDAAPKETTTTVLLAQQKKGETEKMAKENEEIKGKDGGVNKDGSNANVIIPSTPQKKTPATADEAAAAAAASPAASSVVSTPTALARLSMGDGGSGKKKKKARTNNNNDAEKMEMISEHEEQQYCSSSSLANTNNTEGKSGKKEEVEGGEEHGKSKAEKKLQSIKRARQWHDNRTATKKKGGEEDVSSRMADAKSVKTGIMRGRNDNVEDKETVPATIRVPNNVGEKQSSEGGGSSSKAGDNGDAADEEDVMVPNPLAKKTTPDNSTSSNNQTQTSATVATTTAAKTDGSASNGASNNVSANQSTNKRKTNWRCDVCLVAVFEEYDKAVAHEKECAGSDKKGKKNKKAKKGKVGATAGKEKETATMRTSSQGGESTTSARGVVKVGSYVTVKYRVLNGRVTKGGMAHVTNVIRPSSSHTKYDVSYYDPIYDRCEKGIDSSYIISSSNAIIKKGSCVTVKDRESNGRVKKGGAARVTNVIKPTSIANYDVAYTDGGHEKGVHCKYVKLSVETPTISEKNKGNNNNNNSGPTNNDEWACDYCNASAFDTYADALEHERTCPAANDEKEKMKVSDPTPVASGASQGQQPEQHEQKLKAIRGASGGEQLQKQKQRNETTTTLMQEQLIVKPTAERSPQKKESTVEKEKEKKKGQQQDGVCIPHYDSFEHSPTSAFTTLPQRHTPLLQLAVTSTTASATTSGSTAAASIAAEGNGSSATKALALLPSSPPEKNKDAKEQCANKPIPLFSVGNVVSIQDRTWPGRNDQGGVAKILKVHPLTESGKEDCNTYDVKYVLESRKEKGVEEHYISHHTEYVSPEKKKNARFGFATKRPTSPPTAATVASVTTSASSTAAAAIVMKESDEKISETKMDDDVKDDVASATADDGILDAGESKKAKKKKDPNAPKKVRSSYQFFTKEMHPKLKAEKPNLSFGNGSKIISQRWKTVTNDQKKPYEDMVEKDRERHRNEMAVYNANLQAAAAAGVPKSGMDGDNDVETEVVVSAESNSKDAEAALTPLPQSSSEKKSCQSPAIEQGATTKKDAPKEGNNANNIMASLGSDAPLGENSKKDNVEFLKDQQQQYDVQAKEEDTPTVQQRIEDGNKSTTDKEEDDTPATIAEGEDSTDSTTNDTIAKNSKSKSPARKLSLLLFATLLPIVLLQNNVHTQEHILVSLLLPTVTSIALTIILIIMIVYSIFELAMIVTHEGRHHHQSHGILSEMLTAAQDSFFRQPAITTTTTFMPQDEKIQSTTTTELPLPTLREFLAHPEGFHMAFAPAFFGFFAYFGALAAMEEETNGRIVPTTSSSSPTSSVGEYNCGLKSVSGASAGAMAAVMLASGIQPRDAAEFASTFTWGMVADPPGWGGYVKGNNFEEAMRMFILKAAKICREDSRTNSSGDDDDDDEAYEDYGKNSSIRLEDALVPVAVSGFDLLRMKGMNLSKGCMARAARSSAGFPGLFQPVAWREKSEDDSKEECDDNTEKKKSWLPDSLLIDGGITDGLGLNGLGAFSHSFSSSKRIINMVVGDFGYKGPSGINNLPPEVNAKSLVSIAIVGTPMCGPWAMQNGPRAVESARRAMVAALDLPMERVDGSHFVIRVDASKWLE